MGFKIIDLLIDFTGEKDSRRSVCCVKGKNKVLPLLLV